MSRRDEFQGGAEEHIRRAALHGVNDPEDRAFVEGALRKAKITPLPGGGVRVGGGKPGPVDEDDARIIQRAYRGSDAAEQAGHNVAVHGKYPRGFTVYPAGKKQDSFEHRHIGVTPLASGGWDFSLREPDKHLSDETKPYAPPHVETVRGLFDDEMPQTLHHLSRRWFSG